MFEKDDYTAIDLDFEMIENSKLNVCLRNDNTTYGTALEQGVKSRSVNNVNFSVSPTVFDDRISINYFSTSHLFADFVLYNSQGKLIVNRKLEFFKGKNNLIIDKLQNVPEGLLFYSTVLNDNTYKGELIKVQSK